MLKKPKKIRGILEQAFWQTFHPKEESGFVFLTIWQNQDISAHFSRL